MVKVFTIILKAKKQRKLQKCFRKHIENKVLKTIERCSIVFSVFLIYLVMISKPCQAELDSASHYLYLL